MSWLEDRLGSRLWSRSRVVKRAHVTARRFRRSTHRRKLVCFEESGCAESSSVRSCRRRFFSAYFPEASNAMSRKWAASCVHVSMCGVRFFRHPRVSAAASGRPRKQSGFAFSRHSEEGLNPGVRHGGRGISRDGVSLDTAKFCWQKMARVSTDTSRKGCRFPVVPVRMCRAEPASAICGSGGADRGTL